MKELGFLFGFFVIFASVGAYTGLWDKFRETAENVHEYEYKALSLAKKLKVLELENEELKNKLIQLKAEKEHVILSQSPKRKRSRKIASISPKSKSKRDLVKYELYQWTPSQMLDLGEQSLHFKKYEKSAQFYNALIDKYGKNEIVSKEVLYNAGVAAFESKKHYDWAQNHFKALITRHPTSPLARKAKLWLALSYYKTGDTKRFMSSVEEFRLKYRNTSEWKVISRFYEDLAYKFKEK